MTPPPAANPTTAPGSAPQAPIRLLIADDQALVRGALATLLADGLIATDDDGVTYRLP